MTEESELLKELKEIKSEIKKLSENVEKITYIINKKWEREEDKRLGGMRRDVSDYLAYFHVYGKENDDEEEV
jgi:hypothetical protein